ncbi:MAG: DinB family protein [Gemmatimonadales bacterium]
MLVSLQRRVERMERQRAALLLEVAALSPAQLRFHPDPDSWCPLDVVEHLVRVEEAILRRAAERPRARSLAQAVRAATRADCSGIALFSPKRDRGHGERLVVNSTPTKSFSVSSVSPLCLCGEKSSDAR